METEMKPARIKSFGSIQFQQLFQWLKIPFSVTVPSTHIELTSPNIYSDGAVTFDYTVLATGGVTGFATPVTGLPVGHIISDQLFNPTNQIQTVTYTITPVSPVGCLNGNPEVVVITINPTPVLTVNVPETVYCDSSTVSFTVTDGLTSSTGTQVYSVYRDYSESDVHIEGEVPGLDDNQVYGVSLMMNPEPDQPGPDGNLHIQGPDQGSKRRRFIAECNQGGDTTIVITINPTPLLSVVLPENIYCDSSTVDINVIDGLLSSRVPMPII